MKKTGFLTIVILRRYNSCNIGAVTRMREDINKMKSIRAAYKGHCTQDFKKAEKLITSKSSDHAELEALVDRLTRRAGEIAQMNAKIVMSLETEEDILKDTESALLFQDDISDWQFKIKQFPKSKQETPVSQFHRSSFKQAPTLRMHISLPKIKIKSFGGDPLEWLTFWDSFSAAIDKNLELSDVGKMEKEKQRALSLATEQLKERFGKT